MSYRSPGSERTLRPMDADLHIEIIVNESAAVVWDEKYVATPIPGFGEWLDRVEAIELDNLRRLNGHLLCDPSQP